MKKRAVTLLVVALASSAMGLSSCKTRPPDPPAKKLDPIGDPQPVDPATIKTSTPSSTSTATAGSATSDISITPVAVDSFNVDGTAGVWINTKKAMNWGEAKTLCNQYGVGWDLPALTQLVPLSKINETQDPTKKQVVDGLATGRFWTLDVDAMGNHCAQLATSGRQVCDGFMAATEIFKVLCFNSKM